MAGSCKKRPAAISILCRARLASEVAVPQADFCDEITVSSEPGSRDDSAVQQPGRAVISRQVPAARVLQRRTEYEG